MAAPISYQIAKAFLRIDTHPAFPFLDEKWKRFAKKLSEKDAELSALSPEEYARKYDEYVARITSNTATTKSSFDKYQGFLNVAAETQLKNLGYSDSQISRLFGSKKGKESRDRILIGGLSFGNVSVGQDGSLTVFDEPEEEASPPPFAPPKGWAWNDPTVQNMGYAMLTSSDGAKLVMKPWGAGFTVELRLPTDKGGSSDREYFDADFTQPSPGSEVAERAYAYMETKAVAAGATPAPEPDAPLGEPTLVPMGSSGADLLAFANEVASKIDRISSYVGGELVDAAASITPGMPEDEVRDIFGPAEGAFFDAIADLEDEGDSGEAEFYQEELEPLFYKVIEVAVTYAQSEEGEPLEAPPAPPVDPLLEEELLAETEPASEELTALAADVVALAQEANRPTSFYFSELATEITAAGAPTLAQQVLNLLNPDNFAGLGIDPGFGDDLARRLVGVGEKKYGLSGPILVKMGQTFRTSHPSSVMGAANGIYLSLQRLGLLTGSTDTAAKEKLSLAATSFEARKDVEARVSIFNFASLAAQVLAENGVSPLLPARIIGVKRPVEPAGIVATGPDPESAAQEARNAARGYVAPPTPAIPPKPSPLTPEEEPSIAPAIPSEGQLIELIAGTRGDSTKYLPLIEKTYNGYNDEGTIKAAVKTWFKGLLSQPNNSFIIRWTNAPPQLDVWKGTAFETTHQLSAGADGNQNPNGAMWRKVAIPVKILQEQTRAYLEGSALVKSPEQYDVEFAGASLQGPPQDTVSGVPESLTTPYYYIGPDDDGVMAVHITADALANVMGSQAFKTVSDSAITAMTVSNAFGTVTVYSEEPLYLIEGAPLSVTGFLVVLEKYRLASCGSVTCVSALLTEEAEEGEVTVERIQQGATALINGWKNAFSSTLIVEVESVVFKKNNKGQFSARIKAGDAAYNLEVLVRASPAPDSTVKYGLCLRLGGNDLLQFTETTTYNEFISGTAVAITLADKAMLEGITFGVEEKAVTMSGDGLSSDTFSSILERLRGDLQLALSATVKTGLLLQETGKEEKQKAALPIQPRA